MHIASKEKLARTRARPPIPPSSGGSRAGGGVWDEGGGGNQAFALPVSLPPRFARIRPLAIDSPDR